MIIWIFITWYVFCSLSVMVCNEIKDNFPKGEDLLMRTSVHAAGSGRGFHPSSNLIHGIISLGG